VSELGFATERLQGLAPVVNRRTRLLVLGSFPGTASLAARRYYAHPRNLFWALWGELLELPLPAMGYAQRLASLRRHGVGLWDVYATCRREGSLDAAIRQAQRNDLPELRERLPLLRAIAHNGAESAKAVRWTAELGVRVYCLPSSSPANAAMPWAQKLLAWRHMWQQVQVAEGR
jgi:hypoxanthine-DNA glycosylase